MFQGFSQETSDFFWELRFNNDRTWFHGNKARFDALIGSPMKALAQETNALLEQRCPEMAPEVHVSRIWRDARRLFGRGPLKESMWFSVRKGGTRDEAPSFFFELTPATWSCGLGFWCATAAQAEAFRKAVDANPARFSAIAEDLAALKDYKIEGPEYKKPKGDYSPAVNAWYNRKSASLVKTEDFGGEILLPEFPQILADSFTPLLPMWQFLDRACAMAQDTDITLIREEQTK